MRTQLITALVVSLVLSADDSRPEFAQTVELEGLIQPSRVVNLSAPLDGLLASVTVDRGDLVEKNQVVARLESRRERTAVELARARAARRAALESGRVRVDFNRRKLEQNESLVEKGVVYPEDLDTARTEKTLADLALLASEEESRLAQLELEHAQASLERRTIRSSIRGVVLERYLSPGEIVTHSQPTILKVAQIAPLHVEVVAPLSLLGRISLGAEAEVLPEEPVGGVYTASVVVRDQVVDAASGTFGVRLELPNPAGLIPAGIRCNVRFPLPQSP